MNTLTIEVPSDLTHSGTLTLEDEQGQVLLGPWPIAVSPALSQDFSASLDLPAPDATKSMEFRVTGVIPIGEGGEEDVPEFGRYGIIVLQQVGASGPGAASIGDTAEYFIHGGALSSNRLIQPQARSFRLRPEHHRQFVMALGEMSLPILCHCVRAVAAPPAEHFVEPLIPSPSSSRSTTALRVAALSSAVAAAASPFLIPIRVAAASQNCCSTGASYSAVDFRHLAALEGGIRYIGHVPDDHSGVNIAAGLDLGTTTAQDLTDMGFPPEYILQFRPYLAKSQSEVLIGSKARAALDAAPLSISRDQAEEMTFLSFSWHANLIGSQFNHELKKRKDLRHLNFSSLPSIFQTAMTNMTIVDRDFTRSDAFRNLSSGEWKDGLDALARYSSPKPAAVSRAKVAAVSLAQFEEHTIFPRK